MNGSWYKYINLGIVTHVLISNSNPSKEESILEIVDLVTDDPFFDVIEIAEINGEKSMQRAREIIRTAHMETIFGSGYTVFGENLDLNSFDENTRRIAINRLKELIDMAYFFNSTKFAFMSGNNVAEHKKAEARKILIESLEELCEYSKEKATDNNTPLILVLESFDTGISHKLLIGPTAELLEIVSQLRSRSYGNIGAMLDLGHLRLLNEDIESAISQAIPYLQHVHIGNCVLKNEGNQRFGDTHPYFGYPGGEMDVKEISQFLSILKKYKYFGLVSPERYSGKDGMPTISFEVIRHDNEDARHLIANTKRVFRKAWNMAFNV